MGFIDWIKALGGKTKQSAETQGAQLPASPEITPQQAPAPSGVSVTPRAVKPVKLSGPLPTPSTRKAPPAADKPQVTRLPSKPLTLTVADLIPKLPEELRQFVAADVQTSLTIASDDIASDLARGRATITTARLLELCPDFFGGTGATQLPERISLPLSKVVQQIGEFSTRADQLSEEQPEQTYETPFLKGALRDGGDATAAPSGIPSPQAKAPAADALPKPPHTPPPLPASAKQPATPLPEVGNPAAQPPDSQQAPSRFATTMIPDPHGRRKPPATVRASVAGGKIKVGGYTTSLIKLPPGDEGGAVKQPPALPPAPGGITQPAAPSSIKMSDSPVAKPKPPAGLSAVPAQPAGASGSSSAAPFPSPFAKAPETVKVAPMPAFRTKDEPQVESPATPHPAAKQDGTLALPLAAIIRTVPLDHIDGDPDDIEESLLVHLPVADILNQLPKGRVVATVGQIRALLPENAARIFGETSDEAEISLPLREILAALPKDALRKRDDQVEEKLENTFETPFSRKAAEDDKRLAEEEAAATRSTAATPAPAAAAPAPVEQPVAEPAGTQQPAAEPQPPVTDTPSASSSQPLPEPSGPSAVKPKPPMPFISRRALRLPDLGAEDSAKSTAPLPEPTSKPPAPAQEDIVEARQPDAPETVAPAAPAAELPPAVPAITPPAPAPAPAEAEAKPEPKQVAHALTEDTSSDTDVDVRKADAIAALQEIFMTEEAMDARSVLAQISKLPGIASAMLNTADGLKLAGSLTGNAHADALCAMVPALMGRLSRFANETSLGRVDSVTLDTPEALVCVFSHQGISLIVEHQRREFAPGIRSRLVSIIGHLSDIYR